MKLKIENAYIKNADVVLGDYGMEMRVDIKSKSYETCLGGYIIGRNIPNHNLDECDNGNYAAYYLSSVLNVAQKTSVNSLKGTPVRIIIDEDKYQCIGIMNFLDNTNLFMPKMQNGSFNIEDLKQIMDEYEYKIFIDKLEKDKHEY